MRRSIRKLIGGGAAAIALGGFLALIVAPQLAAADGTSRQMEVRAGVDSNLGSVGALRSVISTGHFLSRIVKVAVTPSATCTAAKQALADWKAKDAVEDAAEKAAGTEGTAADVAKDRAELAEVKALINAVRAACGFTRPTPSAACVSAMNALKAWFVADRAEDAAEQAAGTEGTAADEAEDRAERAQLAALWQSAKTACGFRFFWSRH